VLFAAMSVIWGVPYLLIKVAVDDLGPSLLVFGRTAIGAVILLPVALARRELAVVLTRWRPLLVYTGVEVALPWLLLSVAEQRLPSSTAALLIASTPLIGLIVVWSLGERGTYGGRSLVGMVMGLAGVAALVGFEVSGADLPSAVMVVGVAACYAVGPVIFARRLSALPGLGVAAASLAICAVGLAPVAALQLPDRAPTATAALAVAALGTVCTALAFIVFFALIAEIGPVRSTVFTYVNPAVAVVVGVAFLDEPFGRATAAGFTLVLVGSALATLRRPPPPAVASPTAAIAELEDDACR
jgi:drug/metabolite transporter (DMT)-like permease